jgi:hypothetical protein
MQPAMQVLACVIHVNISSTGINLSAYAFVACKTGIQTEKRDRVGRTNAPTDKDNRQTGP